MGREAGGRLGRKGARLFLWLIHVDVQQKTAKFCKAIILQLKNKYIFKSKKKKESAGKGVKMTIPWMRV